MVLNIRNEDIINPRQRVRHPSRRSAIAAIFAQQEAVLNLYEIDVPVRRIALARVDADFRARPQVAVHAVAGIYGRKGMIPESFGSKIVSPPHVSRRVNMP